jgi:hypothetical protein
MSNSRLFVKLAKLPTCSRGHFEHKEWSTITKLISGIVPYYRTKARELDLIVRRLRRACFLRLRTPRRIRYSSQRGRDVWTHCVFDSRSYLLVGRFACERSKKVSRSARSER